METIILLFYALVAVSICVLAVFCLAVGFCFGKRQTKSQAPKDKPKPREIDPEEQRRAKRLQKELYNLYAYNGDPQDEITDD